MAAGVLSLLSVEAVEGQDDCDEDLVYPLAATVQGKDMGEWVAEWWKWVLAIPRDQNPMLDFTGARCAMDQPFEDVFFLVATTGGTTAHVDRTECKAPAGKEIFLPIWPVVAWAPGDCPPSMLDACVDILNGIMARPETFSLDGRSISCLEDHRHLAPWFDLTIPPDNLFNIPEPLTRKFLGDGFWLMLRPLAPGLHTITFHAEVDGFSTEFITYELTVEAAGVEAFRRGDADGNGSMNVTDAVVILGRLFQGQDPLPCDDAADGNDDGGLNITDAVHILEHLFRSGPAPPSPGPSDCGVDPTEDSLDCGKGC
jgi:hypothetical protein